MERLFNKEVRTYQIRGIDEQLLLSREQGGFLITDILISKGEGRFVISTDSPILFIDKEGPIHFSFGEGLPVNKLKCKQSNEEVSLITIAYVLMDK